MKKTITILSTIGSLLIILDTMNIGHSLVLFLFVGAIPGTNLFISPIDMMAAMATAFTVIILRLAFWNNIRARLFTAPAPIKTRKRSARSI